MCRRVIVEFAASNRVLLTLKEKSGEKVYGFIFITNSNHINIRELVVIAD